MQSTSMKFLEIILLSLASNDGNTTATIRWPELLPNSNDADCSTATKFGIGSSGELIYNYRRGTFHEDQEDHHGSRIPDDR